MSPSSSLLQPGQPDRLPTRTYRFVCAQVMSQSVSIMSVSMSAVAGATLASHPSLATLPYGTQMAASLLFTYPASLAMKRLGRRPVFLAAALVLILAGLCGAGLSRSVRQPGGLQRLHVCQPAHHPGGIDQLCLCESADRGRAGARTGRDHAGLCAAA